MRAIVAGLDSARLENRRPVQIDPGALSPPAPLDHTADADKTRMSAATRSGFVAVAEEMENVLGIKKHDCFRISAKTGLGVHQLLDAIVELLPPPPDRQNEPTAALVFDSINDDYRGVICYVRVFAGELNLRQKIRFMGTGRTYQVTELGKFAPKMTPVERLAAGEVGYVIANIRQLSDVTIGDTITDDTEGAGNV